MAPPETMNAALLLSQRVEQLAQRRGVRWTQARLVMSDKYADCYPDDLWSRITLETHTPFCRVDAWMNDAYDAAGHCWVPIRHWPDANDTVRGAFGELVWFEPDGLFRHWRRNARRGARD